MSPALNTESISQIWALAQSLVAVTSHAFIQHFPIDASSIFNLIWICSSPILISFLVNKLFGMHPNELQLQYPRRAAHARAMKIATLYVTVSAFVLAIVIATRSQKPDISEVLNIDKGTNLWELDRGWQTFNWGRAGPPLRIQHKTDYGTIRSYINHIAYLRSGYVRDELAGDHANLNGTGGGVPIPTLWGYVSHVFFMVLATVWAPRGGSGLLPRSCLLMLLISLQSVVAQSVVPLTSTDSRHPSYFIFQGPLQLLWDWQPRWLPYQQSDFIFKIFSVTDVALSMLSGVYT